MEPASPLPMQGTHLAADAASRQPRRRPCRRRPHRRRRYTLGQYAVEPLEPAWRALLYLLL